MNDQEIIRAYYSKPVESIRDLGHMYCVIFSLDDITFVEKADVQEMADTMLWHEYYRNLHKIKLISYENN